MCPEQLDLLPGPQEPQRIEIAPQAWLFRGFVGNEQSAELLERLEGVLAKSPWRQMKTPGGKTIRVSMSACGELGWISDAAGYRYSAVDPLSGQPWPPLPALYLELAKEAASQAGFAGFVPDACLINHYRPGVSMGLHRDADEHCFDHPIVSLSFGLDAAFRFGGATRKDPCQTWRLRHGDALVWGGASRKSYHALSRVYVDGEAIPQGGRINLTFRRAGA